MINLLLEGSRGFGGIAKGVKSLNYLLPWKIMVVSPMWVLGKKKLRERLPQQCLIHMEFVKVNTTIVEVMNTK
jgi:hypothetical protein